MRYEVCGVECASAVVESFSAFSAVRPAGSVTLHECVCVCTTSVCRFTAVAHHSPPLQLASEVRQC